MAWQGKKLKKLKIPYCPDSDEDDKGHYDLATIEEKMVCDYTGFNFDRVEELHVFEFWLLLRDAVVYNYRQTQEGREYLDKCWRLEQTKPDREGLRRKLKKGGI